MGNHIQFIPGRTPVTLIKSCDGVFPPQLGVLGFQLFPTHIYLMWRGKKEINGGKKQHFSLWFNTKIPPKVKLVYSLAHRNIVALAGLLVNSPFFSLLLARSDLLPETSVDINQCDTVHCLCAKHLRLLPLKITCSLILSLSRPDHSYPLPGG